MKISKWTKTAMLVSALAIPAAMMSGCKEKAEPEDTEAKEKVEKPVEEEPADEIDKEAKATVEKAEGGKPWVLDIEKGTIENENYRKVAWTGRYLQMVFMSLKPGEIIDLEVHNDHDQFIRIEQGEGRIRMGKSKDDLTFDEKVSDDWAIFIPAGYWHKVNNTGDKDLKLYTIYAPPEHAAGLIHKTYKDTEGYEH